MRRRLLPLVSAAAAAAPVAAHAADLKLTVELPRQDVAEYHKPYVAIWLEGADAAPITTLAVWYDTERPEHGRAYLKELRQWWRKIGRETPVLPDGITGATRAPGPQSISLDTRKGRFATLAPGDYAIVVEAAREVGGREAVRLPLAWPPKSGQTVTASGQSELGPVRLKVQ